MKNPLILLIAFVFCAGPALAEPAFDADALHVLLEKVREEKKVPALAAAVVRADGLVAADAVGVRKARTKKAVTVDDCFHIGSCTKSMTATLCAMLVEKGKLSWDRTIAVAFPSLVETIHPDYHKVTLEQLLCHRSGLPEDRAPDPKTWPKVRALKGPMPQQRVSMMEIILPRPPATEPGTTFAYSNYGFAIAGAMCEAATGKAYEELIRTMLFEPLGMTSAGFGAPGSDGDANQPWGHDAGMGAYSAVKPGPLSDNPAVISPAGLAHMSIGDWAKYGQFHLKGFRGGGDLLSASSFKKLHEVSPGQDYVCGWLIRKEDWAGGTTLWHNGSNGRWFAVIQIAPAKDFAVVVATNAADAAAQEACRDVTRGIRAAMLSGK
ncbi:MAG: serine hydrolase domain-containing protein [Planctomycetota bacterium]